MAKSNICRVGKYTLLILVGGTTKSSGKYVDHNSKTRKICRILTNDSVYHIVTLLYTLPVMCASFYFSKFIPNLDVTRLQHFWSFDVCQVIYVILISISSCIYLFSSHWGTAGFCETDRACQCQAGLFYMESVSFTAGRKATFLSGFGVSLPAGIVHFYMTWYSEVQVFFMWFFDFSVWFLELSWLSFG